LDIVFEFQCRRTHQPRQVATVTQAIAERGLRCEEGKAVGGAGGCLALWARGGALVALGDIPGHLQPFEPDGIGRAKGCEGKPEGQILGSIVVRSILRRTIEATQEVIHRALREGFIGHGPDIIRWD
jgi:hypothetical protein